MDPDDVKVLECDECGCNLTLDEISYPEDGGVLCEDCYHEHYTSCSQCLEEIFKDDAMHGDGDVYCENCWHDNYFICCECGESESSDNSYGSPSGESMCEGCYDNRCCGCESCSEVLWQDDALRGPDGYSYCDYCFNERYGSCESCGDTYYLEDLVYNEDSGCSYCEDCNSPRNTVIHRWNYSPGQFKMYKLIHENTLFMGTEIEIQTNGRLGDQVGDIRDKFDKKCPGVFYFKEDGSVSNGFEIVSHPFTLQYAHKNIPFKELLQYVKNKGFTSYRSGNCGIHVHLSRSFFTSTEIRKLRMFFDSAHYYIHVFSARGDRTDYCRRVNYKVDAYKSKNDYQEGRYHSLNINTGKSTVEIRVFRGTTNYRRFAACLQFSDAVGHFMKAVSFMALRDDKCWGTFCHWLGRQNRYHGLIKELKRKSIYYSCKGVQKV